MHSKYDRRLHRLEQRTEQQADDTPVYITVASEEAVDDALPDDTWRGKIYVGISPDDWPDPDYA